MKVLTHPASKPLLIYSKPDVRDVRSSLSSRLRLREQNCVDARGSGKGGEKSSLNEMGEGMPVRHPVSR